MYACIYIYVFSKKKKKVGSCFLISHQVGLMLRGMGFDRSTYIYLASGKIYNSDRYMAPLLEMFPNLQTKEMLASNEELAPFKVWMICGYFCLSFNL